MILVYSQRLAIPHHGNTIFLSAI